MTNQQPTRGPDLRGPARPTLSVVVPATDRPASLDRCTAALARSYDPADEIIVVDGPPHLNASAARNDGAARATGSVLVFVDADVEVHPDALGRVRSSFAADDGLTAVHGSYDDDPADRRTVSAFRNLLHHHVHNEAGAGPSETFWSGLGAVRRDAFAAVGGFDDQRYPHPSIEDIELGSRLIAAGGTLRIDPAIAGTHLKSWTLRSMVETDVVRRGVPWLALQVRTRQVTSTLNCGWRHRVSAAACGLAPLALIVGLPLVAMMSLVLLAVLNRSFYGLLRRRLGAGRAVLGVGLHIVHHLCALVALPIGIACGLLDGRGHLARAPMRTTTHRAPAP